MKGWTPQAAERASKGLPASPERTEARPAPTEPPTRPAKPESPPKEPAEKHVQLPPAPANVGPWASGHWTIRRSVAYAPDARVMLTGPADEFEQLLAHLQAFKP